jgi:hypothetical protein
VVFAAGSQTESVKMGTQELSGTGGFTTAALAKQPKRGRDPVAEAGVAGVSAISS